MSQKMPVYANLILIVLLLVGFGLRAVGVDWDGYRHYHPDERYIAWVATSVEFSGHESAADLLNPQTSRLNPFYWPDSETTDGIVVPTGEPRHFAYGHVPLYLGVLATRVAEQFPALLEKYLEWNRTQPVVADFPAVEFIYLTAVARTFTALIDTLTIGAVFLLGKRLFNWQIGLTAAGFLTFNVMHIQLSHFFASDPYMTLFVVLTILCLVTALLRHDRNELVSVGHFSKPMRMLLLGAAVTGLAVRI